MSEKEMSQEERVRKELNRYRNKRVELPSGRQVNFVLPITGSAVDVCPAVYDEPPLHHSDLDEIKRLHDFFKVEDLADVDGRLKQRANDQPIPQYSLPWAILWGAMACVFLYGVYSITMDAIGWVAR